MHVFQFIRANASFLLVGVLLTFLSGAGQTYFISLFAGEIRAHFGLSHGQWGGIYMVGTTASAVAMIWAGGLTDVLRVRVLAPLVLAGLGLSCLAMAINPWLWGLPVIVFALRFLGQGMATHIAVVAMARWFVATRGRALATSAMGFSMGEAFLPLIIVSLLGLLAWQWLWIAAALVLLCAAPLIARLLRQERAPSDLTAEDVSLGMQSRHWTRKEALTHPLFWCLVPAILGLSGFNTALIFHQVHIAEVKGISHLVFVSFFPLFTLVSVTLVLLCGWAIDRFGAGRLLPWFLVPLVAGYLCFASAQTPFALAWGFVFLGLTSGANATLPNAFWAEFYGTAHIGSIKAVAAAVMVLGSAIGPGITGALIDAGIGVEQQFVAIAGYFAFATVVLLIGIRRASRTLA